MESNNLYLRKTVEEDCRYFEEWEKQDFIKEFLNINDSQCYNDIVNEMKEREKDKSKELYTIMLKTKNEPIGRVYLSKIDNSFNSIDITRIYIGDKNSVGKGYGRELMEVLLSYCFEVLEMQRVTLDHYPNNKRASHLYLELGFKYEGIMRNAAKKNNQYFDLHLMSMLREEYLKNHIKLKNEKNN
jgi:RimJ/RimL family protein N-acetyltransferase